MRAAQAELTARLSKLFDAWHITVDDIDDVAARLVLDTAGAAPVTEEEIVEALRNFCRSGLNV